MSNPADGFPTDDNPRVDQLRNLGEAEFRVLFDRYYSQLVEFADRYLHNTPAAEDIVCDVFSKIWNNKDRWSTQTTVRAYLFGAVRNGALNAIRSINYSRNISRFFLLDLSALDQQAAAPDEAFVHAESIDLLNQAIAELPEAERTLLRLRWSEGLQWDEIATVFQTTEAAARMRHTRALHAIKAKLERDFS